MVRLSNKLIGTLNLAILLLSLPVLGGGIYLKARAATECEKFLEAPLIALDGAGRAVSDRGFKEYRLGDFSHWLQKRVEDSKNWRRIRSCLDQRKACKSMEQKNETWAQFVGHDLSPIQSGCCKPPTACNFTFVNATTWVKPAGFHT
ncbi:hypothetical protein ZIOFF_011310 [Zingiber officinale]|uniref:Uncharacterized protein n=1 Tax=Zingiber officinale TaxID=94328 RepID=A0A8J5I5K9_ZINOF|nr:hypothetical protein ZIOFF_011310 [Zingiber officinale]